MDKVTRQRPQTTTFWRERRAEGPSAYQPNALPLGQTGSQGTVCHHGDYLCNRMYCMCSGTWPFNLFIPVVLSFSYSGESRTGSRRHSQAKFKKKKEHYRTTIPSIISPSFFAKAWHHRASLAVADVVPDLSGDIKQKWAGQNQLFKGTAIYVNCFGRTMLYMCTECNISVNLYHVSAQGVDERMINVHYY